MIALNILIASVNDSTQLARSIESKLESIPGVKIHVDIVSTISEVRARAEQSNVIILHLNLADAGTDEVIAAIPELPEPVIIFTRDTNAATHARCKTAGALVMVEGISDTNEICCSILHCLGRSIMKAMSNLP